MLLEEGPKSNLPTQRMVLNPEEKKSISRDYSSDLSEIQTSSKRLRQSREQSSINNPELQFGADPENSNPMCNQDMDEYCDQNPYQGQALKYHWYLGRDEARQVQVSKNCVRSQLRDAVCSTSLSSDQSPNQRFIAQASRADESDGIKPCYCLQDAADPRKAGSQPGENPTHKMEMYLLENSQLDLVRIFQRSVFQNSSQMNKSIEQIIEGFRKNEFTNFKEKLVGSYLKPLMNIEATPGVSLAHATLSTLKRLDSIRMTPVDRTAFQREKDHHLDTVYQKFFKYPPQNLLDQMSEALTKFILLRCNYLGGYSRFRKNENRQRTHSVMKDEKDPKIQDKLERIKILKRFKYNDWWKNNSIEKCEVVQGGGVTKYQLKDNSKGQLPFVFFME